MRKYRKFASYQIIIRCIWTRGAEQAEAFAELERRRLWLSPAQLAASKRERVGQ